MSIDRWFIPMLLPFFFGGLFQYFGIISQTQTNYLVIVVAMLVMAVGHGGKFAAELGKHGILYLLMAYVVVHGIIKGTPAIYSAIYIYYFVCIFVGITTGKSYAAHKIRRRGWQRKAGKSIIFFLTIEAIVTTIQRMFAESFAAHSGGKFLAVDAVFGTFYVQSDASLAAVSMLLVIAMSVIQKKKRLILISVALTLVIVLNGQSKQAHITLALVVIFLLFDKIPKFPIKLRWMAAISGGLLLSVIIMLMHDQLTNFSALLKSDFVDDFYAKEYNGAMPRFAPIGQIIVGDNMLLGQGALTYYNPLTKNWLYNSGFSTIYEIWIDFGFFGFLLFLSYIIFRIPSLGRPPWMWISVFVCTFNYLAVNFSLWDLAFFSTLGFLDGINDWTKGHSDVSRLHAGGRPQPMMARSKEGFPPRIFEASSSNN